MIVQQRFEDFIKLKDFPTLAAEFPVVARSAFDPVYILLWNRLASGSALLGPGDASE